MERKTYYTILILDSCGDIYDEITNKQQWTSIKEPMLKIIEMKQDDKELGADYGVWDYRIARHEEDDENDWQTILKIYKYRNVWKVKVDWDF